MSLRQNLPSATRAPQNAPERQHQARPTSSPSPPQTARATPQQTRNQPVPRPHDLRAQYARPSPAHQDHKKALSLTDNVRTGCWASSGFSVQGCAGLEQQLRACMDTPVGQWRSFCGVSCGPLETLAARRSLWGSRSDADEFCLTYTEAEDAEEEYDQLPSVQTVS